MKCVVDRASLNEGLTAAVSVSLSRTPKPILQCVRLSAEKDVLTLAAYDQEVGLRYRVTEVDITKPGEALVRGDRLAGIVRESADETMALEGEEDSLHVRGGDSHFQVYGQPVREFPPVPELEGQPDFAVKVGVLRGAIERTLFAAARENTRYAINGVLWEKRGKRLQLVATDGRRLALAGASLEKATNGDTEAIVPTKPMGLLQKLHLDADVNVDVKFTSNQVVLRTERVTISSVLSEGRFPKYSDVIPRGFEKKIEVPTAELLSAVKRAALLTTEESRGIRLAISSEGLVLSSRAPEQGEATVKMPAEYSGEPIAIGFNPNFLLEALRVCDESVTLEFDTPTKPGVLKGRSDFLYVVMPVNLS